MNDFSSWAKKNTIIHINSIPRLCPGPKTSIPKSYALSKKIVIHRQNASPTV